MRRKSHHHLGKYLVEHYFPGISGAKRQAFLFGCVEPDHNPFTYCKGSFRLQWLRGHNYPNSRQYMKKLSIRLEKKRYWSVYDYYSLGKLIHYTADAFTYAHNSLFPDSLILHREYEQTLQNHFVHELHRLRAAFTRNGETVMECISSLHREYSLLSPSEINDTRFIHAACCNIMTIFTAAQR